jgi:DNA-binding MarR family transcriptional regulator
MVTRTLKKPLGLTSPHVPMGALLGSAGRAVVEAEKQLGLQTIKAPLLSILWLVKTEPGHAQGEYAAALHYDLATFGRHVEALVADGYMSKTQADYDHRVMELRLTAKGDEKIAEKMAVVDRMDGQIATAMGNEDFQRLKTLLSLYLREYDRIASGG